MKVCFKNIKNRFTDEEIDAIKIFLKYTQTQVPLTKDVFINFVEERVGKMTTGSRRTHHKIFVLTHKRLLIDILRTLAHEWVHEFQHQKLGLSEKDKIQDVGGPEENMANVLSGIFIKQFQKDYPELEDILYETQN